MIWRTEILLGCCGQSGLAFELRLPLNQGFEMIQCDTLLNQFLREEVDHGNLRRCHLEPDLIELLKKAVLRCIIALLSGLEGKNPRLEIGTRYVFHG